MLHARISKWPDQSEFVPTLDTVARAIAIYFDCSLPQLQQRDRSGRKPYIRHLFAYIARRKGFTLEAIGEYLHRDHTTIVNSEQQVAGWLKVDDGNSAIDVARLLEMC